MMNILKQEQFKIDGVVIPAPETYRPVFSTTSTSDSDRDQGLEMHNTPIGTIGGYDLTWGSLTWDEIAIIINAVMNKPRFSFHHKAPNVPGRWIDLDFYVSNMNMDALTLEDGYEEWEGLTMNLRRITAIC